MIKIFWEDNNKMADVHEIFGKYVQAAQQVGQTTRTLAQKRGEVEGLEKTLTGEEFRNALEAEIQSIQTRVEEAKKALKKGNLQEGYDALFSETVCSDDRVCVQARKNIIEGLDVAVVNKYVDFSSSFTYIGKDERHIKPAEFMEIWARYFEGDASREYLIKQLLNVNGKGLLHSGFGSSDPFWLSLAVRQNTDKKIEFLSFPKVHGECTEMFSEVIPSKSSEVKIFDPEKQGLNTFHALTGSFFGRVRGLSEELVEFLMGRSLGALPKDLKETRLDFFGLTSGWSPVAVGLSRFKERTPESSRQYDFVLVNPPTPRLPAYSVRVKDRKGGN